MKFEYPWNNDKKKMKFIITGLKLARYLVTVLGSNIKTVTWMGDNVEYDVLFQGGSRGFLSEDINEPSNGYDVMNSAVNIIEKLGPLDAEAPYVVEFKKEPQASDWANFMISCQGIGDNISISDLESYATMVPGTVADQSDSNLYTTTTSMEPALDNDVYTPTVAATGNPSSYSTSQVTNHYETDAGIAVIASPMGGGTSQQRARFMTKKLAPGYYLCQLTATDTATSNISVGTVSPTVTGATTKGIYTNSKHDNNSGTHVAYGSTAFGLHLTQAIDSETYIELYALEFTHSTVGSIVGTSAFVSAITQSQYEAIP